MNSIFRCNHATTVSRTDFVWCCACGALKMHDEGKWRQPSEPGLQFIVPPDDEYTTQRRVDALISRVQHIENAMWELGRRVSNE